MADDTKYFEVIEEGSRLFAMKPRSGEIIIGIEEWIEGGLPLDSEVQEVAIRMSVARFRAFISWGKEVCG